eukprot:6557390-Pyramimonas_sp.AAC.1
MCETSAAVGALRSTVLHGSGLWTSSVAMRNSSPKSFSRLHDVPRHIVVPVNELVGERLLVVPPG